MRGALIDCSEKRQSKTKGKGRKNNMYRVKLTSKTEGRKKAKKIVSKDTFDSYFEAGMFIQSCIDNQEKICWRGWGMCAVEKTEKDNTVTVEFKPPLVFLSSLIQTYEIIPA